MPMIRTVSRVMPWQSHVIAAAFLTGIVLVGTLEAFAADDIDSGPNAPAKPAPANATVARAIHAPVSIAVSPLPDKASSATTDLADLLQRRVLSFRETTEDELKRQLLKVPEITLDSKLRAFLSTLIPPVLATRNRFHRRLPGSEPNSSTCRSGSTGW